MPCAIMAAPLRGECVAVTSPADKIPSHGTNQWAMTYALDFIHINHYKRPVWHKKTLASLLFGIFPNKRQNTANE